jgi:septal ring factor EnvC (AmiA/AmiB activator)
MFGSLSSSSVGAQTLDECVKLLSVLGDPTAARAALDELIALRAELQSKQSAIAIAETENTKQLAALVDAQQMQNARDQDLSSREAALSQAQTQLNVAAAAVADREAAAKTRELAVADGEAKLAVDTNALTAKIASYRQALA